MTGQLQNSFQRLDGRRISFALDTPASRPIEAKLACKTSELARVSGCGLDGVAVLNKLDLRPHLFALGTM